MVSKRDLVKKLASHAAGPGDHRRVPLGETLDMLRR